MPFVEIISDMWDTLVLCSKTLDLWLVLAKENSYRRFSGAVDVLSMAFSADNRQIVSASRDHTHDALRTADCVASRSMHCRLDGVWERAGVPTGVPSACHHIS